MGDTREIIGSFTIVAVVLLHLLLVPVAIFLTLHFLGESSGLTHENQRTWSPIITAQTSLLALYFGFSSDKLYLRCCLFSVGLAIVVVSEVWGYSMLAPFPEPQLETWIGQLRTMSFFTAMPSLAAGLVLTLLRPVVGVASRTPGIRTSQYRVIDLLVLMVFVSVAFAWFHFANNDFVRKQFNVRVWTMVTTLKMLGATGCMHLLLTDQRRWLGASAILTSLLGSYVVYGTGGWGLVWPSTAYYWAVLLGTIVIFRVSGVRLYSYVSIPPTDGLRESQTTGS